MAHSSSGMLDCVIVGGGPAGLTAALYLARYGRKFAAIDSGASRASWIPESHNIPAFVKGIAGPEILKRQRAHAELYGAEIVAGKVTELKREFPGFEVVYQDASGGISGMHTQFVLLATGVKDIGPALPDAADAVKLGLVRYCPICDGYEAKGKKVAVIGYGDGGLGEAVFIARTFTPDVTVFSIGTPFVPSDCGKEKLKKYGIKCISAPLRSLALSGSKVVAMFKDGDRQTFDTVYAAMGVEYRAGLATALGAASDEKGALWISAHSQTTIPGLYAAGDVTQGLNQIVVAMGQAAIAATAIHNRF
jgi:thioredoxin reductase (NADPH)